MATETFEGIYSLPAGADLSGSQYCGVVINTSGQFVLPTLGEQPHGILQNAPVSGEQARVYLIGRVTKGKTGVGGVTVGAKVSMLAAGTFAVSATQGHRRCAIALDACAVNEIGRFYHVAGLSDVP